MTLGDRMKGYEAVSRTRLVPKMPVMLRLDGKAFHTFTRGMERPYDARFHRCMWDAAKALCAELQGARIAYVQSDEITVLLVDYDRPAQQAWFDYELQKMVSVSASIATAAFNLALRSHFPDAEEFGTALFDSRAWNLPLEEVGNCFIWRQQDASRNSVSMLAQSKFSHKQLHGKNTSEMQDMLMKEHGINWNDCMVVQRRGACIRRVDYFVDVPEEFGGGQQQRTRWDVDTDIPVFTQDRGYIESLVLPKPE